ncbi:MAG: energy transducer TonB [Odoribacteraceae bacterium]|jgi:hypothetical protein|nr:energy transducer TonB [Odoribacteraceae bacterium]
MSTWKEMPNARRAGILGTVAFHLLVAIVLLAASLSREMVHEEIEITIESPLQRAAELEQQADALQENADEEARELLRSIAVNEEMADGPRRDRDARQDIERYIAGIREELDNGREGRASLLPRDRQREADSLQALEARRQRELDSLQSTAYAGKSSVTYRLAGRHKTFLPVPVFRCEFGGTVVVAIAVNPRGAVVKAEVVDAESGKDPCLREVAVETATRSRFNAKEDAPPRQEGAITYHFARQ